MPGHNKQEMCTTLWQAKQKKRQTRQTEGRLEKGNINSARHGQAQCMLSSSLGSSSCAAFVLVPRHNSENCMSICLPLLSVCNICRGTASSSAPAGLALYAWHNCNNRIRSTFPLSARQFLCASLSPCVSLSLLAGGCLRLCGCTQSTLWLIVITPA